MGKRIISFEKALERLQSAVETLEKGDQPLDKALDTYKVGLEQLEQCRKILCDAEFQVNKLLEGKEELFGEYTTEE